MAAPSSSLSIPASARAEQRAPSRLTGGNPYEQLLQQRIWTHGVVEGLHVQDWGVYTVTVAAGAPGTTNVDLLASLVSPDGDALQPVAGKMVYLEIVQLTGSGDLALRRAGATAFALISGTTDTLSVPGGHAVLIDVLADSSTSTTAGIAFDATHKNLVFESTAGGTWAILAAVV